MTTAPLLLLASVAALGGELSSAQTAPDGTSVQRQTATFETAATLAQACKDFIDADTTSVSRFEELGLVRKTDGAPDMRGNETIFLAGEGFGVHAGTTYALQAQENWRYAPDRVKTKTCVLQANFISQGDANALMSMISKMLTRQWEISQGRYIIEYGKKRMVHISTNLSNYKTTAVFTKILK